MRSTYKSVLVVLVAVFAFSAVGAASASAHKFVWKVEKAPGTEKILAAGESKEFTASSKKGYIIKNEVLSIKLTIECKKQKFSAGAEIIGGKPGKAEGTIVFEECMPTAPSECVGKKVKIEPLPVKTELVAVVKPAAKAGKLATLFSPKTSTLFTVITLEGCMFNTKYELTGNAAALNGSQEVEQKTGSLLFKEGSEEITEVETSTGAKAKVELKTAGSKATFEGESALELVSKELWGAF
jgi:hypothetical protein